MDVSETYIKMCDCPEVQKYRKGQKDFQIGDLIANYLLGKYSKANFQGIVTFEQHDEIRDRQLAVWLPRQDQIQGMCREYSAQEMGSKRPHDEWFPKGDIGLGYVFNGFIKFASDYMRDIFKSFEQLWLAFYMWETDEKIWNGEKWIKKEEGKE